MTRVNVTKTFLPPESDYQKYLQTIWDNDFLTNQGPLLQEFEKRLTAKLELDNFHFVTNGTLALQLAIRSLDMPLGEIITTPFSYVATTSAILWERYTPVFVDIDPETLCIDPGKIEAAITDKTRAILPVHVFGNACDVPAIETIASRHGLKVIYDAAHAFGVEYGGKSLFRQGDVSICSFHATKLFHTIEGGGIFTADSRLSQRLELMKRFGHHGDDHQMLGLNAKASEFQAAMGLVNLEHIDGLITQRQAVSEQYDNLLGSKFKQPAYNPSATRNYSYYPIILENEAKTLEVIDRLNKIDVFPRRYFYPSLNNLPYLNHTNRCPVSEDIASRIICLPLYNDLDPNTVERIAKEVIG